MMIKMNTPRRRLLSNNSLKQLASSSLATAMYPPRYTKQFPKEKGTLHQVLINWFLVILIKIKKKTWNFQVQEWIDW